VPAALRPGDFAGSGGRAWLCELGYNYGLR
jgi:hypothetical protein